MRIRYVLHKQKLNRDSAEHSMHITQQRDCKHMQDVVSMQMKVSWLYSMIAAMREDAEAAVVHRSCE